MKIIRISSFFIMLILIVSLIFSGCSGETVNQVQSTEQQKNQKIQILDGDQFALLQKSTEDLLKNETLETISAEEVYQKFVLEGDTSYFVVDIRATSDFAEGSIEGAVNIPYSLTAKPNMLANLPKDKKIIVACYSGHTASQTAAFWKLLGYDAVPMLNGMGGWKTGAGSLLPKQAYNYPVTTEVPQVMNTYELPSFESKTATELNSLAIERSDNYLALSKSAVIKAEEVKQAIDQKNETYFLIDIRSEEDYNKGHIEGSINIPYQKIADIENLKRIPTNKKVVLIGYTGNDASQVVRLLNQLGYDSYPLYQGMRVWTSNAEVNGIAPVSTEIVPEYPIQKLDYDIEGGGTGAASCG